MTTLNNNAKTSSRHFYAVKTSKTGKELAYAFTSVANRNEWLDKTENTKAVTAFEVYQLLNKHGNESLITNRQNRVLKVPADTEIFPEKGQRLIRQ